jgi:hypothetical protein
LALRINFETTTGCSAETWKEEGKEKKRSILVEAEKEGDGNYLSGGNEKFPQFLFVPRDTHRRTRQYITRTHQNGIANLMKIKNKYEQMDFKETDWKRR